jgi:hypothetical protein
MAVTTISTNISNALKGLRTIALAAALATAAIGSLGMAQHASADGGNTITFTAPAATAAPAGKITLGAPADSTATASAKITLGVSSDTTSTFVFAPFTLTGADAASNTNTVAPGK